MAACVRDSRIDQITRACEEINRCRLEAGTSARDPLTGWFLGYMDWCVELHRLIHNWEEK